MADGLPPGEGPETPPQVGPEAPGSPTPPVERQETFQQLQARLAAERTAKAAQERGPGEALEELAEDAPLKAPPAEGAKAEGPTEGNLTPEQIDEIAKRLNEPNADRTLILGGLPDNQLEAVMSRVKELRYGPSPEIPPAIRVEPMDLKAVEASVAEAKTRRLAREAAAGGATGKGQIPEPEAAAAGGAEAEGGGAAPDAAEAPTEEPVGGPAAEAAAAGGEGAGGTSGMRLSHGQVLAPLRRRRRENFGCGRSVHRPPAEAVPAGSRTGGSRPVRAAGGGLRGGRGSSALPPIGAGGR